MKKCLAFILALALCLSLSACGSSDKYDDIIQCLDDKDYSGAIALIQQMAQEENDDGLNIDIMDDIFSGDNGGDAGEVDPEKENLYNNCINFLNSWAENGNATFYAEDATLSGQEAFLYMYDQLQTIHDYKDANEYLKKMLLVENVLLEVKGERVDNMGNTSGFVSVKLDYDEKGRVSRVTDWDEGNAEYGWGIRNLTVTYDEGGRAVQLVDGDENATNAIITRQFNKAGLCTKEIFKNNDGEFTVTYKYDKAGRLIQRKRQTTHSQAYYAEYTYDAEGRVKTLTKYLSSEEDTYQYELQKYAYTYDKAGKLSRANYTSEYYGLTEKNVIEYTVDDAGRTLTEKITYGKQIRGEEESNPPYASQTKNYIYGIYFIYNP